jgi:hypothetical protein
MFVVTRKCWTCRERFEQTVSAENGTIKAHCRECRSSTPVREEVPALVVVAEPVVRFEEIAA